MKLTNLELAELLIAFGTAIKSVTTKEEVADTAENKKELVSFSDTPVQVETPTQSPAAVECGTLDEIEQPRDTAIVDKGADKFKEASDRIAELEAELMKVKGQGALLGLQPIKLTTNNTEVKNG